MIRALIVDNEPQARHGVRTRLRRAPDMRVVGEAASGEAGRRMIEALRPDVVFLDMQMPGMDRFGLLTSLDGTEPPLVICLAPHGGYALRAFGVHAVDYVMKPIDDARFDHAVHAVRQRVEERRAHQVLHASGNVVAPPRASWETRVPVKQGGRTLWLAVNEIDWIQASGDYVTLHVGTRSHMIHESMDGIERRLDPLCFARIHRSAIVALDRVHCLRLLPTRDALVTLRDGTALRVSRRFRHRLGQDRLRPP